MDYKKLAKKVFTRLNNLATLPQNGAIAGGAVANTILSILDGRDYPINDIDIFQQTEFNGFPQDPSRSCSVHRDIEVKIKFSSYDDVGLGLKGENYYSVFNVYRNGILNFIDIETPKVYNTKECAATVIGGFDLNCCGAALYFADEEWHLELTDDFKEFIKTRQLSVSFPFTPYQTAIRLFKKRKELNCYCDIQKELDILVLASKYKGVSKCFGLETLKTYQQFEGAIEQYFSLDYYSYIDADEKVVILPNLFILVPKFKVNVPCDIQGLSVAAMSHMFNVFFRSRKAMRKKIMQVISGSGYELAILAITNPQIVSCNFDISHLKVIKTIVEAHKGIFWLFSELHLNIAEMYKATRLINGIAKREGKEVYGLIENAPLPPKNEVTEDWINSLLYTHRTNEDEILTHPIDLQGFTCNAITKELVTKKQLRLEGEQMRHCVGGYAAAIQQETSRIFHIGTKNEQSTIEIKIINTPHIAQHKGRFNLNVSDIHAGIGKELLTYISSEEYTASYRN